MYMYIYNYSNSSKVMSHCLTFSSASRERSWLRACRVDLLICIIGLYSVELWPTGKTRHAMQLYRHVYSASMVSSFVSSIS